MGTAEPAAGSSSHATATAVADPSAGLAVVASPGGEAAPADPPSGAAADRPPAAGDRWIARAALAITLAPLAVAAVSLVVKVGGSYVPGADHAWTELAVRDVGRHDVLTGLYSKDGWRHPGPLSFYLLAPFYWLTGGASVGLRLGALAVNGGAITGMALIARRRGGLPLMLLTLAGCGLLVRTLGAQVVADPWNLFLPVLPYGLLIFLTWSLACGERWALPAAVFVATFLAQTHVGFVVLAVPLPAAGAAALVAVTGRRNLRSLARPAALSAGLLAVLWLPPLVDVAGSGGSNAADIVRWFQRQPDRSHSLLEGWRVITGQFALIPEWLTTKRTPSAAGQSPFLYRSPVPVLLVAVAAAALVLWRRRGREGRALVLTLALVLALGIVAVARTAGVVFDYRLRVTWVAPMLALVMVCWTGWIELRARRPGLDARRLARPALGCLVAVSVVNGVTAAAERPHETPSAAIASLTGQVLDALDDLPGDPGDPVLVVSPFDMAEWYVSGLVLQLERRGVDARVTRPHSEAMGAHRAIEGDPRATLVVVSEDLVAWADGEPGLVPVATWASPAADDVDRGVRRWMDLMTEADTATGARRAEVMRELRGLELPRNPAAEAKAYLFATDGPYSLRANVYLVVDDGAAAAAPSAPAG